MKKQPEIERSPSPTPQANVQVQQPIIQQEIETQKQKGEPAAVLVSTETQTTPTVEKVEVDINQFPFLQGKTKDEAILILLEKLKHTETNQEIFIKLQDSLKQKEKQYEILRGKQKLDQESKKLSEEKVELLKQEIKQKDEEMTAKDKHIRQLTKKVKQARKDWISNDYKADTDNNSPNSTPSSPALTPQASAQPSPSGSAKWQLNPEVDVKNREIKQLKEAIWAHQTQNASIAQELEHLQNEHKSMIKVKDETIRSSEKELAFVKQSHTSLRDKYLAQQIGLLDPQDKTLLSELQKIQKEYFFSLALSCKLNMRQACNVNSSSLYERAVSENIPWYDWPEWVPSAMTGSPFIKRTPKS